MKYPAKTDIAVLLLFFTRSDTFAQVFEAVRHLVANGIWQVSWLAGRLSVMHISIGNAKYIASIWIIIRAVTRRGSVPTSGHFH